MIGIEVALLSFLLSYNLTPLYIHFKCFVYDLSSNSYSASCICITAMHQNWFDYGLVAYTDSDTSTCYNLFYISHDMLHYTPARCLTSSTIPPFSSITNLNFFTCFGLSLCNVECIYAISDSSDFLRIYTECLLSTVFHHPRLYTTVLSLPE